ncbi:Putative acetyltransferase [Glycine soja]|uniref:Putative acetyltransferase n=1 Tax=Glycine soja TaxID=3848 RepID=A0A0B2QBN1_GLYSO|nr:Putative acetyltransferase [Glycine soja]
MEAVQVISTTTIKAPPSHNNHDSVQKIDLTPWDLQFLPIETIQEGLLFRNKHTKNQIEHLQHSLSSTLAFFPPLAGRLVILQHHDNTVSSHIVCNNAGALFVHAVADNTTVVDILQPKYVPPIVCSFFPLNGVKNHEGTSQPLLAVQVTELVDGIFVAVTINHIVADGKSFWHFVNSWAEISRGIPKISKIPFFERFFPVGIDRAIRFPFTKVEEKEEGEHSQNLEPKTLSERVFHFTKRKISELKSKANAEANTDKISSLQAVLTLLWRAVSRCKHMGPQEEVHFVLLIGVRARMIPPLEEDYFGNAILAGRVTMKAGELLEGGLGKGALEINKMISLHSHEKVKNHYESLARTPMLSTPGIGAANSLMISSSPRFDIYGNDFGWGKPVAVRSGDANIGNGKVTVFAGSKEDSIDIHVSLPYEILEAMGNDPEFVDAISY